MPRGQLSVVGNSNKYNGRTPNQRRELGEKILSKLNAGERLWDIAAELEISEASARRYRDLALSQRIAPTVDLYREQANDRLDETQREIAAQFGIAEAIGRRAMADPTDPDPVLLERAAKIRADAIGLQLRLDERRAKLNGLDAPIKVDAVHHFEDTSDTELQRIIADAQAAERAVREAMDNGA